MSRLGPTSCDPSHAAPSLIDRAVEGNGATFGPTRVRTTYLRRVAYDQRCPVDHWLFRVVRAVVSRSVRRILSRMVIHLGRRLPDGSSGLPGSWTGRPLPV